MLTKRSSGILLHPSSLPSRGGIGDFGPAAYEFLDWLTAGKQTLWQILPLGPVGFGNSPYSSTSAFAGNPLLISLERLADRGYLDPASISQLPIGGARVDFEAVRSVKMPLLEQAGRKFLSTAPERDRSRFERFCAENSWWLDDFVLFDALRQKYHLESWSAWPYEIRHRDPEAMARLHAEWDEPLKIAKFLQFAFFEQWRALRQYSHARGIRIVGDVAIFVSYDSADVWTHPEIFRLREDLEPEVVAGVPPDAFSETGQRWGNPLYNWDRLRERGYDWWVQRMRWANEQCDILRIDHFRGFEACWEIPASEPTAVRGRWIKGPNDDLFQVLQRELGTLPFIAEDLGIITPEVNALRERLQIPGMRVLQFALGNRGAHIYMPHRYQPNTVVYTGTHDNDTTLGWWRSIATEAEKRAAAAALGANDDNAHWALIRAAEASIAALCVVPLQDVLGLGSEGRMNIPSYPEGNWGWRYETGDLKADLARTLAEIAETTDRDEVLLEMSRNGQQGRRETGEDFSA